MSKTTKARVQANDNILALHTFLTLRLSEVERICPAAHDYLNKAATTFGGIYNIATHTTGFDHRPTRASAADLSRYYAYSLPELKQIDPHVTALVQCAVTLLAARANGEPADLREPLDDLQALIA